MSDATMTLTFPRVQEWWRDTGSKADKNTPKTTV